MAGPTSASRTAASCGEGAGWTTFAYSPSYAKNGCAAFSDLPSVATQSSCGRLLGRPRFHVNFDDLYITDAYMGLMRVGSNGGEAMAM